MLETRRSRALVVAVIALAALVTDAAAQEAALTLDPGTVWLRRGDPFTVTARLTLPGGLTGPIRLDATNLPPGVSASSGAFTSAGETPIRLTAAADAEIGGRTVAFTATSGTASARAELALNILGDGSEVGSQGAADGSQGGCASAGFGAPTDLGVLGLGVAVLSRVRRRRGRATP